MSTGETQLFTNTGELTQQAMQLYSQGALATPEKEKVEAYLQENPFEAEALEGMKEAGPATFDKGLEALRQDVHARIPESGGGIPIRLPYWQTAAAVLLMVSVFAASIIMLESRYVSPGGMLAMTEKEKPEAAGQPAEPPAAEEPAEITRPSANQPEVTDDEIVAVPDEENIVTSQPIEETESDEQIANNSDPVEDAIISDIPDMNEEILIAGNAVEEDIEMEFEPAGDEAAGYYPDLARETEQLASQDIRLKADSLANARKSKEQEALARRISEKRAELDEAVAEEISPEEEAPIHLVYGTVLSGAGVPLYDVNISILGTDKTYTTDREGDFKITVDEPTDILRFSYRGISDLDVPVANREHLIVKLSSRGSEVSTIGEDGRELPASMDAAPGGGYSAYKTYLLNTMETSNVSGRIVLEFTVTENGELKDFEVVRGIDEKTDEALIEAMQNGPRWRPAFEQGMAVPSRSRYRLRIR